MKTRIRALVIVLTAMLLAAGQTSIASAGSSTGAASAVTWGARQNVGASHTWSYGSHLTTSSSPTETFLHDVATTDLVNGIWVDNNGPYLGVNYVRGDSTGTTWTTPFRVNAKSQHGDGGVIAASGEHVYVSWFRRTKYFNYNPEGPRRLLFRRNTNHGESASWDVRLALTPKGSRVGLQRIAASGAFVYVAYTNANTGDIRLAISNDLGVTWATSTIGTTSATRGLSGFEGGPSVAAAGSNVAVSWIADGDGSVVASVSTTDGSSWDSPTTLGVSATYVTASSARDTRIGAAWMAEDGATFSLWATGTWGSVRTVAPLSGTTYAFHYQPALVFGDAGQVGIAWGACWENCDVFFDRRLDVVWAESKDDGVTWYDAQVVGSGAVARWRGNDSPALLWPTADTRILAWNGYRLGTAYTRIFLKIGSGTN